MSAREAGRHSGPGPLPPAEQHRQNRKGPPTRPNEIAKGVARPAPPIETSRTYDDYSTDQGTAQSIKKKVDKSKKTDILFRMSVHAEITAAKHKVRHCRARKKEKRYMPPVLGEKAT
jgi:hypothetical protein